MSKHTLQRLGYTLLFYLVVTVMTVTLTIVYDINPFFSIVLLGCLVFIRKGFSLRFRDNQPQQTAAFQHYKLRLSSADSLEAKQNILNDMLALNLLQGVDFSGLDLAEIRLVNAELTQAQLEVTKQVAVDLSNANLKEANLSLVNLRYATIRNVNLRGANLYGATLDSADMCHSNLQNANLRAASLRDVDLNRANLRGANLSFADLQYANLIDTDLTDADLSNCVLPDGTIWKPNTDLGRFIQGHHNSAAENMLYQGFHKLPSVIQQQVQKSPQPKK